MSEHDIENYETAGENCIENAIFSPDELKFWATVKKCGSMAITSMVGTENVTAGELREFSTFLSEVLFQATGGEMRFSMAPCYIPPLPAFKRVTDGGDLNLGKVVLIPIPLEMWVEYGDRFMVVMEAGIRAIQEDDEYAEYLSAQEIE